jgi:hypothetical protein
VTRAMPKSIERLGENRNEGPCELCGQEAAELYVLIKDDNPEAREDEHRETEWDLCTTCVLHLEKQAENPEAYFDLACRAPDYDEE